MSLENDITQVYASNNGTSVQSTASTTSTQSSSNTTPNTVFDRKQIEEQAKQFGITPEEFIKIAQDPKFAALSPQDKIKYINEYKAAKQTTATDQTATKTTVENATNTSATDETKQTSATQTAAKQSETEEDHNWAKDYEFDSKKYSNLEPKEMYNVYCEEYAKNKFLYGDKNNPKDIEAWNNLSDKERKKLIKNAGNEILKDFNIKKNIFGKRKVSSKHVLLLQNKMSELQTANHFAISVKEYYNQPLEQQNEQKLEYFNVLNNSARDNLSDLQNLKLTMENTKLNAVKTALAKIGVKSDNLSYGDMAYNLERYNIKLGAAMKDYLTEKAANGKELSNSEQSLLKIANALPIELLEDYGSNLGKTSILETEIQNSKFADQYANANTLEEQIAILAKYANSEYKDDSDKIIELMLDANKCGNLGLLCGLIDKIAPKNRDVAERLSNSLGDLQVVIANDEYLVNTFGFNIGRNTTKAKPELQQKLSTIHLKTVKPENSKDYYRGIGTTNDEGTIEIVRKSVYSGKYGKDWEKENADILINNGSENMVKDLAIHAYEANQANQEHIIVAASGKYDGRVAKAITDNETITRLDKGAQTGSFKAVQANLEKYLPEREALDSLKALADQISLCDVSNQLDMHKSITGSKYSEIQEYAASNIHNYDKSVQADAIKVTYDSGNVQAIEAVNRQLSQCDPEAVKSIANEIQAQVQAMEARHTANISTDIADKLTTMDAARDPAASAEWSSDTVLNKRQEYKEIFMKADAATKFRMISKLQGVWQKEVITHIATYCPEMLSSLIASLGSDLFQLQLTPEVKNKIMLEMLRVPDMQADALEYFKNNTNSFSSNVKQTCAEMLVERQDSQLESPVLKQSLRSELAFMSTPDDLVSGGKVSNREYYNNSKNDLTFWKRDKDGYFIC